MTGEPILARCGTYAGQTHPCYGVQPIGWEQTTRFMPWVFDGRTVRWGFACDQQDDALAVAVEMANQGGCGNCVGTDLS
jgi:hypothetical protein